MESAAKSGFKPLARVACKDIAAIAQQLLDLRIGFGHPFDHQLAANAREKISQVGFEVIGNTPEEFAAQVRREVALVARLAKAANIKLD